MTVNTTQLEARVGLVTEDFPLSKRHLPHHKLKFPIVKILVFMLTFICCMCSAIADVSLPRVFNNNMVIQRDTLVPIWGKAQPGEKVTVRFAGQEQSCTASADGRWMLKLNPMEANAKPQEMIISGSNSVTFKNVLIGEVWLCSGDFGVYYELFGCKDAAKEIAKARFPNLRLLHVTCKSSNKPLEDIEGLWVECLPKKVSAFSGMAYYFGRKLHLKLKVPVGIIAASYRYSSTRSWLSPESIQSTPDLEVLKNKLDSWDPTTAKGKEVHLAAIQKLEAWLPVAEKAFAEGTPVPK